MTDENAGKEFQERIAHEVMSDTLELTPDCYHLFAPLNPVTMVCMRCGGYATRERVRAWMQRGAQGEV